MNFNELDMVLFGATVLTMDSRNNVVDSIGVKDGRICWIGAFRDIERAIGSGTQKIDLNGKTVIPGFIDAHTHMDMYGMMTSIFVVDCHIPPLSSKEDILAAIGERVKATPKGDLILGQGRPFQPYPAREQLDRISPHHPVIIKPSMHWYLLNTAALKRFRITNKHPTREELYRVDPCALIHRDRRTGMPTGQVEECWNYFFPRSHSPFNYEQTREMIKEGIYKHLKCGITSLSEFVDYAESSRIYQDLYKSGELNLRLQLIPCFHGLYKTVELDEILHVGLTTGYGNDWIQFGGVKIFVDRQQDTTCTSFELKNWFSKVHRAGLRMYMHAITREGQDMALAAIEGECTAGDLDSVRAMRHRIEHMGNEHHDPTYFQRMKYLGAIALPTAYFMNIGPNKLLSPKTERCFMFRTMLDMGLCVAGNSDGGGAVPEAPNPMYQIWCMVNRRSLDGELVCPSEKISAHEAVRVYTAHSAFAGMEEKTKGSIEVGKFADFAVLSENPLTCSDDDLKNINAEMTIVGGKIMYRKGEN